MAKYRFEASIEWVRGGGKEHLRLGTIPIEYYSPYLTWTVSSPLTRSDYCTDPVQLLSLERQITENGAFTLVLSRAHDAYRFSRNDWEMAAISLSTYDVKRQVQSITWGNPGRQLLWVVGGKRAVGHQYSGLSYYVP